MPPIDASSTPPRTRSSLGPLFAEARVTLRTLSRQRLFALVTVLTLALGLGSATALFSVLDQQLFRKPYPHTERLAVFGTDQPGFGFNPSAYLAQILPCMEHGRAFEAFAVGAIDSGVMDTGTESLGVDLARVNAEYFPVLRGRVRIGRLFGPDDFKAGAEAPVVVVHSFWQKELGGDPGVIGRAMRLAGKPCRIIGVLDPSFVAPRPFGPALFTPLRIEAGARRDLSMTSALVRLKPGVSLAQANAEAAVLAASADLPPQWMAFLKENPLYLKDWAHSGPAPDRRLPMLFLGAVALLLVISFLNALHLMLVRLSARRQELGVRLALGASRWNLMRLLGLESLLLISVAGAAGLLLARLMIPALLASLLPVEAESVPFVHLDGRAFLFTLGLGILCALLLAVLGTWRAARMNAEMVLKEDGAGSGEGKGARRLRELLVVSNAALAMLLLTGTGLMSRSVQRLVTADRGFDPSGRVAVWLNLPMDLQKMEARAPLILRLEEKVKALPWVREMAVTSAVPLAGSSGAQLQKPDGTPVFVCPNPVSSAYAKALGLRMLQGEWIPERAKGIRDVVVLNRTMARVFFGDEPCLGRVLSFAPKGPWRVIGVVEDVKDRLRSAPEPQFYYPWWQMDERNDVLSLVVDCGQKPSPRQIQELRRLIHETEPRAGIRFSRGIEEVARRQVIREASIASLLQVISGIAAGLAWIGLFSVMVYGVQRREREFGLRMALGARSSRLFAMVLQRGIVLGLFGVAAGLFAAWGLTRYMTSLLYETSPLEPSVFAWMALLLLGALVLAAVPPAWRAARLEPARLMREE
jgi:putative ABC transport system permease protein